MIASAMLYVTLVGLLFVVAAACAERLLAEFGRPRRVAWLGALAFALAVPPVSMLQRAGAGRAGDADLWPSWTPPGLAEAATAIAPTRGLDWDALLLWLWAAATLVLLVAFAGAWWRLGLAARQWRIERTADGLVHVSDSVGPAVFGVRRPRIVLPRWLLGASPQVRATVMAHEQEHLAACDHLVIVVTQIVLVLLPWHLPLWWLAQRLRVAVEIDCDARVLRRGVDPVAYGEVLLAVGQRRPTVPLMAAALTEPATQLERRIRIMLAKSRGVSAKRVGALATLVALLVACSAQLVPPVVDTAVTAAEPEVLRDAILQSNGVQISSRTAEIRGPGVALAPGVTSDREVVLLNGDVVVRVEQSIGTSSVQSDRLIRIAESPDVFALEGAVRLEINELTITTPRAVVTPLPDGGAEVRMDSAAVVRADAR